MVLFCSTRCTVVGNLEARSRDGRALGFRQDGESTPMSSAGSYQISIPSIFLGAHNPPPPRGAISA